MDKSTSIQLCIHGSFADPGSVAATYVHRTTCATFARKAIELGALCIGMNLSGGVAMKVIPKGKPGMMTFVTIQIGLFLD